MVSTDGGLAIIYEVVADRDVQAYKDKLATQKRTLNVICSGLSQADAEKKIKELQAKEENADDAPSQDPPPDKTAPVPNPDGTRR